MSNFCPKARTNPFGKMQILRPICIDVFIVQKSYYHIQNFTKQFSLPYFALKEKFKKGLAFNKIYGLTSLEKCKFFDLFILLVLLSRKAIILSRRSLNSFSRPILPKKKKLNKCPIFDQIHGLTPMEKCKFCDIFVLMFLQSRGAIIISRRSFRPIWPKKKS